MDDTSAFLATDGDDNTPQNSRDLAAEWGPSDFDVRHRLVASATWNVPASAARRRCCAHWQVSGVFTAQSGRPFTPRVSFDNSNTGNIGGGTFAYDRPNVVTGAVPPGARTGTYDGQVFADRAAVHVRQRRPQQPDRARLRVARPVGVEAHGAGIVAGAGAAAGNLQRAVAAEPEPARQLRRSPDVRTEPVGAAGASGAARGAPDVLTARAAAGGAGGWGCACEVGPKVSWP